jgi:hypothetical protein
MIWWGFIPWEQAKADYREWTDNYQTVDSGYPFKSDKELERLKRKFGVCCLEVRDGEWGAEVNGEWWHEKEADGCEVAVHR